MKHPNSYLPKYNVQSETDGETTPLNGKIKNSLNVPNTFESEEELDVDDEQLNEGLYRISNKIMKSNGKCKQLKFLIHFSTEELEDDNEEEEDDDEEDDDDDDQIPSYGFPRNRREPSDIDFIISNAGMLLSFNHNPNNNKNMNIH